jgi:hypothetical protein
MGYFEDILKQSAALGGEIAEALEPARTYLAHADELNKQLDAARRADEAEYTRLVESAASTGKLPAVNGHGKWIYDSPSSKLVVASVALCHTKASTAAREAVPRLFEALQRQVAGVVKESTSLVMSLPEGINSEMAALRASNGDQRHFKTWSRLGELLAIWEACHELNRLLQKASFVPGPQHPRDRLGAKTYEAYKHPARLAEIKGPISAQRHLAAAVAVGAEPGLYSWPDATVRWERLDRRQRNYSSMQTFTTIDPFGSVLKVEKSPETPSEFVPSAGVS